MKKIFITALLAIGVSSPLIARESQEVADTIVSQMANKVLTGVYTSFDIQPRSFIASNPARITDDIPFDECFDVATDEARQVMDSMDGSLISVTIRPNPEKSIHLSLNMLGDTSRGMIMSCMADMFTVQIVETILPEKLSSIDQF